MCVCVCVCVCVFWLIHMLKFECKDVQDFIYMIGILLGLSPNRQPFPPIFVVVFYVLVFYFSS
jgi:hypothetical protein